MLRIVGRMLLVFAATGLLLGAGQAKGSKKEEGNKGTVVKVDMSRNAITIKIDNRRETFFVTADTNYFAPDGSVSADGIRHERLVKGNEVRIVPDLGGKTATEVHLSTPTSAGQSKRNKIKDAEEKR